MTVKSAIDGQLPAAALIPVKQYAASTMLGKQSWPCPIAPWIAVAKDVFARPAIIAIKTASRGITTLESHQGIKAPVAQLANLHMIARIP